MITRRVLMAGLPTSVLAAPHVARAATRVVRVGHNGTDASHYGQGGIALAAAVAADPAINGAVRIEVHGAAELGDDMSMLKSCVAGTLDMVIVAGSIVANVVPDLGLLNAPFLFADVARARAVLDGPIGAELAELAAAKGLTVLGWGENGLRHITANKPIRTPADMQGLKIRVPQSEVIMEGIRALGAEAAPLSFSLLREALRTGQFQAQENPIVTIESIKLYELQRYVSLTGHIYDSALVIGSSDLAEDLTAPQRDALASASRTAAAATRRVAEEAQSEGIQRLRAVGMTVIEDPDRAAFRLASQPFLDRLAGRFGPDRVMRMIAAAS